MNSRKKDKENKWKRCREKRKALSGWIPSVRRESRKRKKKSSKKR